MNKREIIERLKNIAEHAVHTVGEESFVMSLDDGIAVHEAIELLEKPETNCSEFPNNSATISRQAVTKFLNDWLSCLFENCHKQSASDLKMIIKDFKNLPSVQPELKELSEWKADFKGYINALNMPKDDYDGIMEYIDEVPSVQPERKTGRWIPTASGKGKHECSRCHEYAPCYQDGSEHLSTFCVLCGAKMEEGK